MGCWKVKELIESAYIRYADGEDHSLLSLESTPVEGGPALDCNQGTELDERYGGIGCWIDSDRFTIDAAAEGSPSPETMRGPMLQALLDDEFKLRLHRPTRGVPSYELTIAGGGPRLQASMTGAPFNRLQTTSEGMVTVDVQEASVGEFCKVLSLFPAGLGRPAFDRTGITGRFDFHLVYGRDGFPPSDVPSLATALEGLGLKLKPATGSREFLVVDHLEIPSGN
jgi:uncharacterized protein (TIGR03435 family)